MSDRRYLLRRLEQLEHQYQQLCDEARCMAVTSFFGFVNRYALHIHDEIIAIRREIDDIRRLL
jgi:hypothetical protein